MEEEYFDFESSPTYKKARDLVLPVFELTGILPEKELPLLGVQLRTVVVTIPAAVVRAATWRGDEEFLPDYIRELSQARFHATELDILLSVTEDLGYAAPAEVASIRIFLDETKRLIDLEIRQLEASGEEDDGGWDVFGLN